MSEEEWLKAISLSKEELIKWLNEMYQEEARLKSIIERYEEEFEAKKELFQDEILDLETGKNKIIVGTKVTANNGIKYYKDVSK